MPTLFHRFATPLTTALFAISAISGIALFFHLVPSAFHAMHEWLSLVLILPFALHLWRNWKPFTAYAKRATLWWTLAASLAVAAVFAAPALTGTGGGGNPAFRAVTLMTQAPLSDLAPLLKTTPEALLGALNDLGAEARSADQTLAAIAPASGKPASELLFAVIPQSQ